MQLAHALLAIAAAAQPMAPPSRAGRCEPETQPRAPWSVILSAPAHAEWSRLRRQLGFCWGPHRGAFYPGHPGHTGETQRVLPLPMHPEPALTYATGSARRQQLCAAGQPDLPAERWSHQGSRQLSQVGGVADGAGWLRRPGPVRLRRAGWRKRQHSGPISWPVRQPAAA